MPLGGSKYKRKKSVLFSLPIQKYFLNLIFSTGVLNEQGALITLLKTTTTGSDYVVQSGLKLTPSGAPPSRVPVLQSCASLPRTTLRGLRLFVTQK